MKHFSGCLSLILLTSCATNNIKTIEGYWFQEFLGYKNNVISIQDRKDTVVVMISKEKTKMDIKLYFVGGYGEYLTDSIFNKRFQLKFRRINLDKTSNYYNLKYKQSCDCFLGEMKSYTGNVVNIKLSRAGIIY